MDNGYIVRGKRMIHVFVINNFSGGNLLANNLREHLATILGLRYFVFNTQREGYETYLVRKISSYFEDEQIRFYCCGGSGTLRNMLNGIDNFDNVELAFLPCGMTNDFLKNFNELEPFRNIDNLIFGKTIMVDYIKTNHGLALNTLSYGFDSNVVRAMNAYKMYDFFGNQVPYIMSVLTGLLLNKSSRLKVIVDGEGRSDKYVEIVVGNGCVLGGNLYYTPQNSVFDGKLSLLLVSRQNFFALVYNLLKIMNKRISRVKNKNIQTSSCEKIILRSTDGKHLFINFDGELVDCGTECDVEVVERGLKFVIPRVVEVMDVTVS